MMPKTIPSAIEYANGIMAIAKNAGTASDKSCQSISITELIINTPTTTRTGAVAAAGINPNSGAINNERKNRIAVVSDVRPVLPPSATPAELSTNVVTVEVPMHAPKIVPIASVVKACDTRGNLPFSYRKL